MMRRLYQLATVCKRNDREKIGVKPEGDSRSEGGIRTLDIRFGGITGDPFLPLFVIV